MTHRLNPQHWVNSYSDYLFNYAIARVSDAVVAQDLVQDPFLAGLKAMDNFKGQASERTWLIAILKRKIIDHYRKSNSTKGQAEVRMQFHSDEASGEWLEERVSDPFDQTAEDKMENTELGEAIMQCIEKLPPKQAEVFKRKTLLKHDTEAICNDLNITASNLWVIIHRARTALASCLGNDWF